MKLCLIGSCLRVGQITGIITVILCMHPIFWRYVRSPKTQNTEHGAPLYRAEGATGGS